MTSISIQKHIDNTHKLIAVLRTNIMDGYTVDTGTIEKQMNLLLDLVSNSPKANLNINARKLAELMSKLNTIEDNLHKQHKSLSAKIKTSRISAAAAYRTK